MNSKERLDAYISGNKVDRRPNLTIVGSVVTQYTGIGIDTYCKDYKAMTEAAVMAARDLKLDYVQIASDLSREAEGYGSVLEYKKDGLPVVARYALDDITKVSGLKAKKASDIARMYDLAKAVELANQIEGEIYPMTLSVGPATVAANIRGVQELLMDMFDEPEACQELFEKVNETILDNIHMLAQAGAKYIYVADPVASLVSPASYHEFIQPLHTRIYSEMVGLGITGRLHMCGDTEKILPYSLQTGAKIIDIDHVVDFKKALELCKGRCIINGNIDPVEEVFSCTSQHTKEAIISCAKKVSYARAMFMPGCELPTRTPLENVKAIYEALVEIGE